MVEQLGEHTLVHVPRQATASQTLLDVKVTISTCNHDLFNWQCNSRFIESVNISGSLLGDKRSVHITAGKLTEPAKLLTVLTGDGEEHPHDLGLDLKLGSTKHGSVRLEAVGYANDESHTGFKLHLGDFAHVFVQRKLHDEHKDVHWLDVKIQGLRALTDDVGGLLGFDDHTDASAVPKECPGLQKRVENQKIHEKLSERNIISAELLKVIGGNKEPFVSSKMSALW